MDFDEKPKWSEEEEEEEEEDRRVWDIWALAQLRELGADGRVAMAELREKKLDSFFEDVLLFLWFWKAEEKEKRVRLFW